MSQPRRRWARAGATACSLAVATVVLAALPAPRAATAQQPGGSPPDRPPLWSGKAAAAAVSIAFNTDPPLLPLSELIRLQAPYGQSSWSSTGSSDALVGLLYPGTAGTRGPSLLCEFAGGQCPDGFPPPYPLSVRASYPSRPDVETPAGRAHAGRDLVHTEAGGTTAAAAILGPLSAMIEIGAFEATTHHSFSDDGTTLTADAHAVLSGVTIAGVVEIDSIEVRSRSISRGGDATDEVNRVTVSGVTVAGQPARITDRGLVVAEQASGDPTDAVVPQLVDAFEALGLQVRLLGASTTTSGGTVSGSARGVQISFDAPLEGPTLPSLPDLSVPLPIPVPGLNSIYRDYVGTITLGLADSRASVSTQGFGLEGGGDLGGLPGPPADAGVGDAPRPDGLVSPAPSPATPGRLSGNPVSLPSARPFGQPTTGVDTSTRSGEPSPPAVAAPAPTAAPRAGGQPAAGLLLLDEVAAGRLADLYLAIVLVTLLALAATRTTRLLVPRGEA